MGLPFLLPNPLYDLFGQAYRIGFAVSAIAFLVALYFMRNQRWMEAVTASIYVFAIMLCSVSLSATRSEYFIFLFFFAAAPNLVNAFLSFRKQVSVPKKILAFLTFLAIGIMFVGFATNVAFLTQTTIESMITWYAANNYVWFAFTITVGCLAVWLLMVSFDRYTRQRQHKGRDRHDGPEGNGFAQLNSEVI